MLDTSEGGTSIGTNLLQMEANDGDELATTLLSLMDRGLVKIAGFDWDHGEAAFDLTSFGKEVAESNEFAALMGEENLDTIAKAYQEFSGCDDPYNPRCECDSCMEAWEEQGYYEEEE